MKYNSSIVYAGPLCLAFFYFQDSEASTSVPVETNGTNVPMETHQTTHEFQTLNLVPEIQTPPPEETSATVTPELQIPNTEDTCPRETPVLSIDTLTPPPEAEPSLSEGVVKDNGNIEVHLCWVILFGRETHGFNIIGSTDEINQKLHPHTVFSRRECKLNGQT